MTDIVIVNGARTAMGGFQGSLASVTAPELGAVTIKEAIARARSLKAKQKTIKPIPQDIPEMQSITMGNIVFILKILSIRFWVIPMAMFFLLENTINSARTSMH